VTFVLHRPVARGAVALSLALSLALVCGMGTAHAADRSAPAITIHIDKLTLLDLASVGSSLIGVGERGVIARSDDGGLTWSGRLSPSSRTLTAVTFLDAKVGVAVGHGGTILRTEDAGQNWAVVPVKDIGRDAVCSVSPR